MTQVTDIDTAIDVANNQFMSTFKSGDAAGMATLYTQDGQVLRPNRDFIIGQRAIQAFWQAVMDMGIKEAKLETVDVESHGNTAVEISKFTLLDEGGQVINQEKYIIIWKLDQGRWKLYRDIFNASMPAPRR